MRRVRLLAVPFALLTFSSEACPANHFTWEATIDRSTGVATSREYSVVRMERDDSMIYDHFVRKTSKDFIASWADFLCQGRISFGLLQAKHDKREGTASLHFRGLPRLPILTFGSIQERKPYQWELPIMPSWLALSDDRNPSNHRLLGSLRFQCRPGAQSHCPSRSGPKEKEKETLSFTLLELESQIVGYRPWLAGKTTPISRARKRLYLQTQSRIHAYVTRRFHRAWREALVSEKRS